jgi:hypothetical protein
MKKLEAGKTVAKVMACEGCGEAHENWSRMTNEVETANFTNNQNRNPGAFGNTYNQITGSTQTSAGRTKTMPNRTLTSIN